MKKLVVFIGLALMASVLFGQKTVSYDTLSVTSKGIIANAGGVAPKGEVIKVKADSVGGITLVKNVPSRERDTAGNQIIEDQYLIQYWKSGQEMVMITTEDPGADAAAVKQRMSDPGLKQGDDEFITEAVFEF